MRTAVSLSEHSEALRESQPVGLQDVQYLGYLLSRRPEQLDRELQCFSDCYRKIGRRDGRYVTRVLRGDFRLPIMRYKKTLVSGRAPSVFGEWMKDGVEQRPTSAG